MIDWNVIELKADLNATDLLGPLGVVPAFRTRPHVAQFGRGGALLAAVVQWHTLAISIHTQYGARALPETAVSGALHTK